jgi:hypothetical protein
MMFKFITTTSAAVVAAGGLAFASPLTAQAYGEPIVDTTDTNGDGYIDGYGIDRWGDGSYDIVANDMNENGIIEGFMVDLNNNAWLELTAANYNENGIIDLVAWDTDEEGTWDTYFTDTNQNGIGDHLETQGVPPGANIAGSAAIVSAPTNPSAFYNLMLTMAGMTGQATFGDGDSDGDGWYNNQDWHPDDRYRH